MDRFPATSRQRWYLQANQDGWSSLNVPVVWQFEACDRQRLQAAFDALVARHEALRTTLIRSADGTWQRITPHGELLIEEERGTTYPSELQQRVLEILDQPFQVDGGILARARLLRVAAHREVLVLSIHHAVCDGWSAGILFRDLAELYQAAVLGRAPTLPALTLQFADYATWEWETASRQPPDFWHQRLESPLPQALLGNVVAAKKGSATFRSFRFPVISAQTARHLHALAASCRTTPARVIGAGVVASLVPYLGTQMTFGVYVGNRDQPELLDVVGDLADRLPVRIDASDNPTFIDLINRLNREISSAHDHFVPLAALAPVIRSARGRQSGPLLDVTLNYLPHRTQRSIVGGDKGERDTTVDEVDPSLEHRSFCVDHWRDGFGMLDYQHRPQPDGSIGGYLLCNVTVIPDAMAIQIAEAAAAAIEFLVSDPAVRVGDFSTPADRLPAVGAGTCQKSGEQR